MGSVLDRAAAGLFAPFTPTNSACQPVEILSTGIPAEVYWL